MRCCWMFKLVTQFETIVIEYPRYDRDIGEKIYNQNGWGDGAGQRLLAEELPPN